jgi:hypothetical protein
MESGSGWLESHPDLTDLPELNLELAWLGGKHMGVGPEEVEPATIILLSIDS